MKKKKVIDKNAHMAVDIVDSSKKELKNSNCMNSTCCFKENGLFNLLSDQELEKLNSTRVEVNFKKGENVYKEGMPLTHLTIIRDGFGKIFVNGLNGKNLILNYTKLYGLNGGIGFFTDQRHHSTLTAATDCKVCLINIHSINEVMHSNRAFMYGYLKDHSKKMQHTYHRFIIVTQKNMEARIAQAILYLKETQFTHGPIDHINRLDLAEFTAMSKESVIRVLKEFKNEKHIELKDQKIIVVDEQALQNISDYG